MPRAGSCSIFLPRTAFYYSRGCEGRDSNAFFFLMRGKVFSSRDTSDRTENLGLILRQQPRENYTA